MISLACGWEELFKEESFSKAGSIKEKFLKTRWGIVRPLYRIRQGALANFLLAPNGLAVVDQKPSVDRSARSFWTRVKSCCAEELKSTLLTCFQKAHLHRFERIEVRRNVVGTYEHEASRFTNMSQGCRKAPIESIFRRSCNARPLMNV